MPLVDGFEVLRWIRHHEDFKKLAVVMLTTSDSIADMNRAYDLGANSFLVKPLDFGDSRDLARAIERLISRAK